MKFNKRISKFTKCLFGTLLLMPMLSLPAFANENEDENKQPIPVVEEQVGSISIRLTDTKDALSKEGVEFGLTKVADWNTDGGFINVQFVEDANLDVNTIENANDLEEMARTIQKIAKPEKTLKTDVNGTLVFDELQVGMYLVNVTDYADYENITPFLVSVPLFNEVDKVMDYDVTVLPKHEAFPTLFINKVDSLTGMNITNKEFEFTLFNDKECKNIVETKAGNKENGTAEFVLKDEGVFYIKETKAPKGYLLSKEIVKIEFNGQGLFINDKLGDHDEDNVYSIKYQNSLMPSINTGVSTSLLGSLFLLVTSFAALRFIYFKLKK